MGPCIPLRSAGAELGLEEAAKCGLFFFHEDVSNTVPVAFMGAAGEMISDMADMKRWVKLYATAKTGGPAGYRPISECKPFLGNAAFGLGMTCSAGWFGYTGGLPGYNTADYYSPRTGVTIVAWVPYMAEQPPEGIASAIVRDIARIVTPAFPSSTPASN